MIGPINFFMKTKPRLTDEEFKYIYSRVSRLCVEIIIKTSEGILLTLRDIEPYKNLWHIPGGTVLYRETIREAARRTAKEELGIDVEILGLAGYFEYPGEEKIRGWGWPIAILMFCAVKSGEFKLDKQAREIKFFKKFSDIPENTVEEQKKILKKLLET